MTDRRAGESLVTRITFDEGVDVSDVMERLCDQPGLGVWSFSDASVVTTTDEEIAVIHTPWREPRATDSSRLDEWLNGLTEEGWEMLSFDWNSWQRGIFRRQR